MTLCSKCLVNPVSNDEAGLTKKLVNRGTEKFYCYECLSKHFSIPQDELKAMVERFRDAGCTLFAQK